MILNIFMILVSTILSFLGVYSIYLLGTDPRAQVRGGFFVFWLLWIAATIKVVA